MCFFKVYFIFKVVVRSVCVALMYILSAQKIVKKCIVLILSTRNRTFNYLFNSDNIKNILNII